MRAAIAVAFSLVLACGSTERTPSASRSSCAGVCGTVTDATTGKPIGEFTLALFAVDGGVARPAVALPSGYPQMPGPLITTTTIRNAAGWFDVSPGAATRVILGISARGYSRQETQPFVPDAKPLGVPLVHAPQLRLEVSDESGRAVAGAAVHYDSPARPLTETLRSAELSLPLARTNEQGVATLDQPELASLSVVILKEAFVAERLTIARGVASSAVRLRAGRTLRGVVRLASGAVASGAAIEARCDGFEPMQTLARRDGTFELAGLPAARCDVLAAREMENGDRAVVLDSVRGSAVADLRRDAASVAVVIPPSGRVSGKLTGLDRIEDGYAVTARRSAETVALRTSTNGGFSGRLAPGAWTLSGSFDEEGTHLETDSTRVDVADGDVRQASLAFGNATTVEIRVEDQPLSGPLTIEPKDGSIRTRAQINPRTPGLFEISGLSPGVYVARFSYWQWDLSADLLVPSRRQIALRRHQLALDIGDREGRQVYAQVEVTRRPAAPSGITISHRTGSALLAGNAEGHYVGWELAPGAYEVSIHAAGYRDARAEIVIPGTPPSITLQTIDRPFARPAIVETLGEPGVAVLKAVVASLQNVVRDRWRQSGETATGRLVIADETLRHPGPDTIRTEDAAIEQLQARPLFNSFTSDTAIHRIPHDAIEGVLAVRFADVPTVHPNAWDQARTEFAMIDGYGAGLRWDRAAGIVLLTSPEVNPANTEAIVLAKLLVRGTALERLYLLRARDGGWRIVETIDVSTEPGC